ncbi:hypothetical protein C3432_04000 [Citrobacter amalonaticus]|uniref:Uncharacterized protein n=1 Tax=Citrobacter amalonaticus TaxID=35703 RepID=A0A2S4S3L4_CITAM|nr:hypothetical protein [Citrobacter amalonaticus]POT59878.1 hypothetical protein C3432_04000 [Citrobacter amalonaticus]POT78009.1 hypothetical protein C3436_11670 [Citrobacter amalonaticus]POU68461.1 hypothetical protein C3430_05205 [Citrobacter amalonaticus]POV08064.1 hypothetical protein C3424_05215 [Citrobacter amalonaticus]
MKKIFLYMILFFPVITCAKTIQIKDGLYYGYWVYKDKGVLKEYGVLANNPRKDSGEYILNPVPELAVANEIYVEIKDNVPELYFYHESSDADLNVVGWADAKFLGNDMIVLANTIRFLNEDSKERVSVGKKFNGKVVQLKNEEVVPINAVNGEGFSVDCNNYMKSNNYAETGLPDVEESDPSSRKDILIGYPATVFAVGELGICSAFLDEDIVPQIKNGWIQFRRLN